MKSLICLLLLSALILIASTRLSRNMIRRASSRRRDECFCIDGVYDLSTDTVAWQNAPALKI